jgi:NAD(P)-dependent dehydrogenase (short-subunit alcohol dehydrogenase family)
VTRVWLITGTSRGFGRVWAQAALERGDSVAATARDTSTLEDLGATYGERLLALELDVTDKAAIEQSVRSAHQHFGRLDVVVNNAGYGQFGAIEELTEQEARRQIETNLFGPLWVTKAVVPLLREQRSGHIIQVSSIGGVMAFPMLGLYHASKWGLEGFSQSLAAELAEFGVHVTIVEPGGFTTCVNVACRHSDRSARNPVTRRQPPPRFSSSSTLPNRRCGCSLAAPACRWSGVSTPRGSRPGSSGTGWPSERRAAVARALRARPR